MGIAKDFYKSHGSMTAPGDQRSQLSALPKDVAKLSGIVQGVLIHRELTQWLYDLKLSEERKDLANIRPLNEMLAQIRTLDDRPLSSEREPARRLPSVCRHFSTMLCGILREQGVPARARCGFGAYFNPGKFEDHWVCEYWNAAQSRWILVDAQIDAAQRKVFRLDFDPLDVPRNRFIIAGDAWQACRTGGADANRYGLSLVPNLRGLWFVAGNVVRDLASLNRMEMLPWDVWGLMAMDDAAITEDKRKLLDSVAALTLADESALPELREVYESDDQLRVPKTVFNAMRQASEPVGV